MSTLIPLEYPFACGACDATPSVDVKLSLCSRCKTIRYCVGKSCQRDHWPYHEKVCITAGDEAAYTDPNTADLLPIDPREINLRDEPRLSDERCDELIAIAQEALQEYVATCPAAKAPKDMEREDMIAMVCRTLTPPDLRLSAALDWDLHGRKADGLCLESKDDVVELMRREVFQRLRLEKEKKALSIMHQCMVMKKIDLHKLARDDPGLLARGLRERIDIFRRRGSKMTDAITYQDGVLICNGIEIDWLVESFLLYHRDSMPANRDYNSFLTEDEEVEDESIKKAVAILLALKVKGVDEGVFWEIKDRHDKRKMFANVKAFERLTLTQP